MKKIFFIFLGFIAISSTMLLFYTHSIENSSQKIIYSRSKNEFLRIYFKDSLMSYGSGHKILELYTWYFFKIDKVIYGEHNIDIKVWDDETILINIFYINIEEKNYIESWIKKKQYIGKYCLKYEIRPIKNGTAPPDKPVNPHRRYGEKIIF